jgi:hypothetical protein
MKTTKLSQALRGCSDNLQTSVERNAVDVRDAADAAELVRVLAGIVEGKSIDKAFGAPGDWGYGTPIGDGIFAMLKAPCAGADLIAAERARQIHEEGWTAEHDDTRHQLGELLHAAQSYVMQADGQIQRVDLPDCFIPRFWPWAREWWKPSSDPVRNLVKAGALIAAEIDRIQRERAREGGAS